MGFEEAAPHEAASLFWRLIALLLRHVSNDFVRPQACGVIIDVDRLSIFRMKVREQFEHVVRERVRIARQRAPQRARRRRIRSWCAAEAEIDASREQRLERAELLGNDQRCVIGEMIPPAPTRMVFVPAATCAITTAVGALAIPGML